MTFLGEHYYSNASPVSEAERHRSRDNGTVISTGAALAAAGVIAR